MNGVQTGPLTFTFTFNHEETVNNLDPCPYPTPPGQGCTDRVTFIDAPDPTTFTVGGKTYTLSMNFLDEDGNPVTRVHYGRRRRGEHSGPGRANSRWYRRWLEVTKSGPATMNVGQWGIFAIDARNTGPNDAWNTTIRDVLPDGATGGMCDATPEVLSAQVFAADGVTPVPGKGPLVAGSDYALSWAGAPTCELTLAMLTPAAAIDTDQRLIITYRAQLDADSQDGATLTNVAGATEWFDDESSNPDRVTFTRTLTDGTPGVLDHEDAHTVTVALFGYFFEKSVADLTSGVSPAATAAAGDTLRYTLRLQSTDVPLDDLTFYDDLGALNASAVFVPGSLTLVPARPARRRRQQHQPERRHERGRHPRHPQPGRSRQQPGPDPVRHHPGPDPQRRHGRPQPGRPDQHGKIADSDDPNIDGQADPEVAGDEDPTQIVIAAVPPPAALLKANTQATAAIGEEFSYQITVPTTPYTFPMYDVRITDDLTASSADLRFVSVSKISGSGPWTPVNTGTDTNLVIEDPAVGIDIPAGEQIVVEITVVLEDTPTNVAGLTFTNTADYTYNRLDEDDASQRPGSPGTTPPMTVVEPALTLEKSGPAQMTIGTPATFTLNVHNPSAAPAWNPTILDRLPDGRPGACATRRPPRSPPRCSQADGVTPVSGPAGPGHATSRSASAGPADLRDDPRACSARRRHRHRPAADHQLPDPARRRHPERRHAHERRRRHRMVQRRRAATRRPRRTYTRTLTDGTPGVLDHQDAHTVTVALLDYFFEKTVANLTSGASPAATAAPGDTLRYTLRFQNTSNIPLDDLIFLDDLGALNTSAAFLPGTLTLVALRIPPGADISNTNPNGGTNGTGILDIRNLDLAGAPAR